MLHRSYRSCETSSLKDAETAGYSRSRTVALRSGSQQGSKQQPPSELWRNSPLSISVLDSRLTLCGSQPGATRLKRLPERNLSPAGATHFRKCLRCRVPGCCPRTPKQSSANVQNPSSRTPSCLCLATPYLHPPFQRACQHAHQRSSLFL